MSKRSTPARKPRKFRILYAVNRGEWYEIEAADRATAIDTAYEDGTFVETGHTTDVVHCDDEEVTP